MLKRGVTAAVICIVAVLMGIAFSESLEVQNSFIKIAISKGDVSNRTLSVSSGEGEYVSIVSGSYWLQARESEIYLAEGETKRVALFFNSSELLPGAYVSILTLNGEKNSSQIPVILEVQSRDLFFDANLEIPPQYTEIMPGKNILAQVKVFDLTSSGGTSKGLGVTPVRLEYEIKSIDGKIIASESEEITVNGQATVTKSIPMPSSLKSGDYVFSAASIYKSSIGTSTKLFRVSEPLQEKTEDAKDDKSFYSEPYFIILSGLFVLIIVLLFFTYFLRDRDKLLMELRKYNSLELRQQRAFLREQARMLYKKGVAKEAVKIELNEKIHIIKKKHKKRESVLKKMREKKADDKDMLKKLNQWKKEGYSTFNLEYKMKGLNDREMNSLMGKWKKEGFGRH